MLYRNQSHLKIIFIQNCWKNRRPVLESTQKLEGEGQTPDLCVFEEQQRAGTLSVGVTEWCGGEWALERAPE